MSRPLDEGYMARVNARLKGMRLCHNKSARKHRKQGRYVRYIGEGWYTWRASKASTEESK